MALETATNPTTGERVALINNEWKPFSETATNPTTKEKLALIDNEWQSLGISAEAPVPQEDTPIGAGVRSAIEKAPGALGGLAGFGAGMAAVQGLAVPAGVAVGAAFPPAAPITAPLTYGAVSVIGGLLGATAAGTAVDAASDYLFSQADPDGWKLRQEEKKRNPRATMLGDVASGLLGMSPATITRGLLKSTGERAVSGTLQGGLSAGMDVLGGEAPDWQKAGAQTVAGFAMPSFNRLGQSAFNLGQGASRAVLPNSWTKFTPEVAPKAPIVDESGTIKPATTADEESAFIKKLNESIEAKKAAAEAGSSGEPPPPPRVEPNVDVINNTAVDEVSRVQKQIDSIDNPVLKKMAIEGSVADPKMAEITTVSALGEHIKTTLGPDHLASRVLDALLPTLPKDSPSRVVKADEYDALYKSVGGTDNTKAFWHPETGIVMNEGFGDNSLTAAHEISHAVLQSKIEAINSLPINHPDYIKLTKLVTDVTELMNSVRSKVEVTPENKAMFDYSLNDPHEFIANGIFEPRVANALLKIEQKQPGFVSKLVSYIGKFLGLEPKQYTALHELIRLTQKLAKAENPDVQITGLGPKGSIYNLETKRKDIFNKDSDTAKAWKAIGMFDLAQPVNERFSTASRDEATREIYKKYLTKKDVLDAARIQGNIKSNPTTKEGSVGLQHINNLLDKRSDGKWLEEITNLKKIKPSEMERAGEFYGEMQDNRTAGEKAKDTMSYNNEKVNFLKKDSKELEDMAHDRASSSAHSDQAEAYQEARYEGKTLSDTELQKIFDNSYKYEYAKELTKLKNLQNAQEPIVKGSLLEDSPAIVKASKDIDVRSLVESEFIKHAEQVYANEGEEAALAFFRDWKQHSTDKKISLPNTEKGLADTFFKLRTWAMADRMRYRVAYDATTYGREISMKERFFPSKEMKAQKEQMDGIREIAFREREGQNDPQFLAQRAEVEANPELKAKYDFLTERLKAGDTEVTALIQRIRTLTGDDRVVAGLETGQARYIMKSKKERTLEELLGGGKDNPLIESNKEASSIKGRSLFQLEDGRVIQVEKVGDVEMVLEWKLNKEGTPFPSVWADKDGSYHAVPGYIAKGKPGEALTAGSTIRVAGKDMVIKDGQVHNIERLTPYRYFKDAEATQYKKIMELEKMARELELIDKMKENKFFNLAAGPDAEKIPAGWKQITDVDTLPQLRGWSFDPKVAWIIEDFAKTWDKGLYLRSTDFLIKNMMLVPIPHIFNEAAHLWALRGLSGWVTPKGLTRFGSTLGPAFKDVAEQGRFYQEVAKEGGSLLGADPRNNEVFNAMGRDYVERAVKIPAVKAALAKVGYSVADFYNAWSQNSQKSMWFTRDVMYMQALREIIKLNETRGTPVTTKQAIDLVQDHMPAYRLPTVIMNSRLISKALQNPYLAVFSRYHYGVTKSIANIGKELNPQNLKTTEGRQEFKDGIDRMLATVVAMTIGYAAVDAALEVVFGPGTKMRRAGPFHIYHAIEEAVVGNKDASALLFAVFTFNPVTSTLGQLATNRQLYKNKYPEIYHPNDPLKDKALDVASYLGRSIPQASGILRANDQNNYAGLAAKQFDVQIKTQEQIRASEKAKKREDTELKYRKIKREQGVYRP